MPDAPPPGSSSSFPPPSSPVSPPRERSLSTSRLGRIADHLADISQGLRDWADLRVELVKTEAKETIDLRKNEFTARVAKPTLVKIAGGVLFALAGLFLLVALGLGLGRLLWGHYWGGFLIVVVLLALAGFIALKISERMERRAIEAYVTPPGEDGPARISTERHDLSRRVAS